MADTSLMGGYEGGILSGLPPQAWAPENSGANFLLDRQGFSELTPYQHHQDC